VPDGVIVINDKKANIVPGRINKVNYDKTATWILKGGEGRYIIEIIVDNNIETKDVLITNEPKYEKSEKAKKPMFSLISDKNYLSKSSNIDLIKINYKKLILIPIGIKDWLGWLGTYIWSSLIFTMVLRKMMKVY